MKVLIALPALNEEANLGAVLERIPRGIPHATEVGCLVVDDGSSDRTSEIARQHGAAVVAHPESRGVGAAFHSAVRYALESGVDILVTIDADGQFEPEQIPDLVAPIAGGRAGFVTGTRFSEGRRPKSMPSLKYWGNRWLAHFFGVLLRRRVTDISCGFRAYSREALYHLNLFGRFTYTQETILDLWSKDLPVAEIPIRVRYFSDRRSRVAGSLTRYGLNMLNIVTRTLRDLKPLRFFGTLGAVVFLVGFALEAGLLVYYLRTGGFTPYKFVGFTGVALNIGGLAIFGIALLADMLNRTRLIQERILYHQRRLLYPSTATPQDEPSDANP